MLGPVLNAFFGWGVLPRTEVTIGKTGRVSGQEEGPATIGVAVTYRGEAHKILVHVVMEEDDWRIANIIYDNGKSLIAHYRDTTLSCSADESAQIQSTERGWPVWPIAQDRNADDHECQRKNRHDLHWIYHVLSHPRRRSPGRADCLQADRPPTKPLTCPPVRSPCCKIA